MSSILITGGTGFLGRAIVSRLLGFGNIHDDLDLAYGRVCIYSRNEHAQATMREEFEDDDRLRWFIGDVRDYDRLEYAMRGCVDVIHAAALKRVEVGEYCPDEMVKTNVLGTMNVLRAAADRGAGGNIRTTAVVLVSSDKAVAPVNAYGATKMLAEKLTLAANVPGSLPYFNVVRYGNVAGSTGSVIPTWLEALRQDKHPVIRDGLATRFWLNKERAVDLVFEALAMDGQLHVPDLPGFQLGDLAEAMGITPFQDDVGLGPGEKAHEMLSEGGPPSNMVQRLGVEDLRRLMHEAGL